MKWKENYKIENFENKTIELKPKKHKLINI